MARDRPDAPAAEVADEDEIAVPYLAERAMVRSRAPSENLDVRTFVAALHLDASRCPGPSGSGKAAATSRPAFNQALRNNDTLKDSTMGG